MKVPWKYWYCEDGSHCYEFNLFGNYWSLFWDLKNAWFLSGPGFGDCYSPTKFSSQIAVDAALKKFIDEKLMPSVQKDLTVYRRLNRKE